MYFGVYYLAWCITLRCSDIWYMGLKAPKLWGVRQHTEAVCWVSFPLHRVYVYSSCKTTLYVSSPWVLTWPPFAYLWRSTSLCPAGLLAPFSALIRLMESQLFVFRFFFFSMWMYFHPPRLPSNPREDRANFLGNSFLLKSLPLGFKRQGGW